MALIPVAAASIQALADNFGPLEPIGNLPLLVAVRTRRPDALWVRTGVPFGNVRGQFRIADNESPRPQNRTFGVPSQILPYIEQDNLYRLGLQYVRVGPLAGKPLMIGPAVVGRGSITANSVAVLDGASNTIMVGERLYSPGFEKTFFDNLSSLYVRLPFFGNPKSAMSFWGGLEYF